MLVALAVSGCDSRGDGTMCELSSQQRLENLERGRYSGLALLQTQSGLFALWSRPDGTYVRALDPNGVPSAPRRRIGSTCEGGLDAAMSDGGVALACMIAPQPAQAKPGGLFVLSLSHEMQIIRRIRVADVGLHANGVTIDHHADGWIVAWNDGHVGGPRVWRADLGAELQANAEPQMLSSPRVSAGMPHLYVDAGRALISWAETWQRRGGVGGHVVVDDGQQLPQEVAETRFAFPTPSVSRDQGGLFVGFRDIRPPFRKSGLYLQRLGQRLRTVGEARRAGRANGRGRPCLQSCAGNLFGASPRTWSRDFIIGVNLFDPQFQQRIRERQVYEFGHRFNDVVTACTGEGLVLLVAEERTMETPHPRLATVTLRCQ